MADLTVVNYGLGNVQAFVHIYRRLNIVVKVASTAEQLSDAKKIILPGVGSFDWAITRLQDSGMRDVLDEMVVSKKVPVLGVCVGMQIMVNNSEEGKLKGLGWVNGVVKKFRSAATVDTPLPHMGWNDVLPTDSRDLFRNIKKARYYFLHSYCVELSDSKDVLATTEYSANFISAIRSGKIYGTQFHPEKSHCSGVELLRNFAEI